MSTAPLQQVGSRGRHALHTLLLLCALLFLALTPTPGQAAIHIPDNYSVKELKKPPEITAQPESTNAFSSDAIALTCEATGNPPPTYRWVRNGTEFDPSDVSGMTMALDSGSFTIKDAPINEVRGKYSCYASNELGTAVSKEVFIITEETPSVQKENKEEKKVVEGSSVILQCNSPKSSVTPVIHWMDRKLMHIQQSDRVTQGRDGNLYFSHVTMQDSRSDYTCNVQFMSAFIIMVKEPISLKVEKSNSLRNRRPQMMRPTGPRSSYLVLLGQSLDLECIVQGLPTPSVMWVRRDGLLSESRTTKESFNRLLHFSNITERDDGEYQCIANNTQGTVKHTYTVTVEAAPYWIKEPESELYAPGETVKLECQADGIPTPTLTWSINGNLISDVDPDSRRTVKGGTLILKDVQLTDTAVYQCQASNKHGSILVNSYVYVIELPAQILTKDNELYSAVEGQMAELHCETFGSPRPKITWEGESWDSVMSNPRMTQLGNGTLQIHSVSQNDTGMYTCSVDEAKLTVTAELKVYNRTLIVEPPQDLHVQRGETATFSCQYQMDSNLNSPQIQWRKSKNKLHEYSDGDRYVIEGSELRITGVEDDDEGTYTCEVITSLDIAKASGSLTVVDRPEAPYQLQISEPGDRSVTLSWTPGDDNKSPLLGYVVEAEETSTDREDWEEIKREPGSSERTVLTLSPFLSYRFRVIAINKVGKSDPSMPTASYSTPAARPDSNPEKVRSESLDPDTLVIMWKELDRRSFNGPDFRYNVMWRKVVGSGPSWHSNFTTSPPFVVTNVGDFTAFDIKVQAVNDMGEGPEPKSIIGYSGEDYPLEAPLNVGVVLLNSTAIRVTWAPVNRETVRGHLMGYKLRLMYNGPHTNHHHRQKRIRKESQPRSEIVVTTGPNEEKTEIGGLQPYSLYSLTVSVFNSKGDGPESEDRPFQMPEGVPGPPLSLILTSPSETEMKLHWTKPAQENGVLKGYVVQYQQLDNADSPMQEEKIEDPRVKELTLKDLNPHSHYRFYLRGFTAAGEGESLFREGATLLDGGPPQNISLSAGETSLNLSWVTNQRHRNVNFQIKYLNKNAGRKWELSENLNSSQSFYLLQGLNPSTHYRLQFLTNNAIFWETDVRTEGSGVARQSSFVTEGWFIGIICALVLLLLILLILCFIKRSKGGKYSVKEKEEGQVDSEARPMKDDTFGEYSDIEEKCTASQPSLCENSKLCSSDGGLDYSNGHSVQTDVIVDDSLGSQYGADRDGPEDSRLSPATNNGVPNSGAILD